jgi:hypothetical protein
MSAPRLCARIARPLWPVSNGKRRAAQTIAGIRSAGTYHSARFRTSSLPVGIDIPGLLLMSISRQACIHEKRPRPVATPNTHGQGGVHAFRMRAVSAARERLVNCGFSVPAPAPFIT